MDFWTNKRIIVAIGGGIAAYKSLGLIRSLRDQGARVTVVATRAALRFVTEVTIQTLAGEPLHSDLFGSDGDDGMEHIRLARIAELVIIAPATADLLARMAGGHANDLLTALLLARRGPVLAAPAMNSAMWEHPATQRNMARLKEDGVQFVGPERGSLICGEVGEGRMAVQESIVEAARRVLTPNPLQGRRFLVTAGPTREELDPVRYLSNHSSGKMGWAVCLAALRAGARVSLVHGPVDMPPPLGAEAVRVDSAQEMHDATMALWSGNWSDDKGDLPCDAAILTAAVSDFRPATRQAEKIGKMETGPAMSLTLERNLDILATLAGRMRVLDADHSQRLVVGFAAETGDSKERGQKKLARKGCDLLVVNNILANGCGFGSDTNQVLLLGRDGRSENWPLLPKIEVGARLIQVIADLLAEK